MNKVILVLIVACRLPASIMLTDLPTTQKVQPVKQVVFTAKSPQQHPEYPALHPIYP